MGGNEINEGLLKTASGADAVDLAAARVEGATAKLTAVQKEQAAAEQQLIDVRARGSASADQLVAATDRLAAADKKAEAASADLSKAKALEADTAKAAAAKTEESSAKTDAAAASTGRAKTALSGLAKAATVGGLSVLLAGGYFAKTAADYQQSTTVLQTSGGEVASQMGQVRKGLLSLSGDTGTALQPLIDGMYMVGSAGYTGGAGLRIMRAAAQGAKAENADLGVVANATTTLLKDYGTQVTDNAAGQRAANVAMNETIAVVSRGKTTTEGLAGSYSTILPLAAALKVPFYEIGGAMATMTGQGESAQNAAQNLSNMLRNLAGGNAVATKEMMQFGLNANDVKKALGDPNQGLNGALTMVFNAVQKNMGPAGLTVVQAFQNSASAAQNAQTMISKMPASLQDLAKQYQAGSITAKQWKLDLQQLDPVSAHLMSQFAGVADQTHSFNSALTKGTPAQQTAAQAMQTMLGGATGLNVALMLTGNNAKTFTDNIQAVKDASKGAGENVDGWDAIQKNLNQRLSEAKMQVKATGITIGTALLPGITSLLSGVTGVLGPIATWISGHQGLTLVILGTAAGLGLMVGAINLAAKAFKAVQGAINTVRDVIKYVTGLFGGYSDSATAAAASSDAAATSADGLAISEDGAAVATEGATTAADASRLGWLATGASALVAAGRFVIMKTAQLAVTLATKAWTIAQVAFNAVMDANPIILVAGAIAALAAGVIYAYTHFTAFKQIVDDVLNWLKQIVVDVIDFVKDHWEDILGILTLPIGGAALLIFKYWDQIKGYFSDAVHAVESTLSWFGTLAAKFGSWLASVASSIASGIAHGVSWFLDMPGRVEAAIFGYFSSLGDKFGTWVEGVYTSVKAKGADVLTWFKNLPGNVLTSLGDLSQTLWNAGIDLIKGFIGGIESMFSDVANTLGSLTSKLTDWKGPPTTDKILLVQNGQLVMQGFEAGLDKEIPAVRSKLQGLTATIRTDMTPGASSLGGFALAPAGVSTTGAAPQIVIDLRGSQVLNDQAAKQLADKIGRVIATQILPAAGVRIRS